MVGVGLGGWLCGGDTLGVPAGRDLGDRGEVKRWRRLCSKSFVSVTPRRHRKPTRQGLTSISPICRKLRPRKLVPCPQMRSR